MRITTVALLCVAAAAPLTAQERDLHFEVTVPVSIEDAFRMWIDSAEAREFLALEVRIDPWVGGRYEANFDPEPLGKHETRIRIRHYGFGSDANWAASRRFYEQSGWPWIIKRLEGRFTKGKENGRDGHAAISSEQQT